MSSGKPFVGAVVCFSRTKEGPPEAAVVTKVYPDETLVDLHVLQTTNSGVARDQVTLFDIQSLPSGYAPSPPSPAIIPAPPPPPPIAEAPPAPLVGDFE